jgi:protein SCO1/2
VRAPSHASAMSPSPSPNGPVLVDVSYRLGLAIVVGTVAVATAICLATADARPSASPAGQDLGSRGLSLGPFRLTERSGRVVTDAELADRVWVAAFIFTRCRTSCPRITAVMRGLQEKLAGTGVQMVSLSVDPEHDTPEVLAEFAQGYGADPGRWWFLTGPKAEVYDLISRRFLLGVAETSAGDQQLGADAVSHSSRLALVDRGNTVIGYFDSDDPAAVRALMARARHLAAAARPIAPWVRRLPTVNAILNGTCAVLLVLGWTLIRSRQVRGHIACMAAGVAASALFLAGYLIYHAQVGSVPFRRTGPIRLVYLSILLSHTVLAATVVPLVGVTLVRAVRRRFAQHARIARVTFPIWLYVSVTGVVIYLLLYGGASRPFNPHGTPPTRDRSYRK